jgi:hypothetical protein
MFNFFRTKEKTAWKEPVVDLALDMGSYRPLVRYLLGNDRLESFRHNHWGF